ncbi:hypothetical protein [Bradyrhizobium sp. CCBAU 051011]|uniref:hypothetical protein n=1 Tax=Bradyrhizobium sp. CCBAU 051011 TaxID=858422 RepID=UPI00137A6F1F|nr:hypothetical protein [Bradyrhizobium sp. CCBAU 051011]
MKRLFAISLLVYAQSVLAAENGEFPHISVVGGPEVVFDYSKQSCEKIDIPDQPLRAFRKLDGTIVAIGSHYVNRALLGPSFDALRPSCHTIYQGADSRDPHSFDNKTWLAALWTDNGRDIVVLGHNEYHADAFEQRCAFRKMERCWYNSITMLKSNDEGYSFHVQQTDPILASPNTAEVDQGARRGYFDPSNIISLGEYKYLLVAQRGFGNGYEGRCLLRNLDPSNPSGWEMYTGSGYVKSSGSPYNSSQQHPLCSPVVGLKGTLGSVTRIRGTPFFAAFLVTNRSTGDFISAFFSTDLINWREGGDLLRISSFWSKDCQGEARFSYPSVVDDNSNGRNFDDIGGSGWLFLVRGRCQLDMTRDLVRFRLVIK